MEGTDKVSGPAARSKVACFEKKPGVLFCKVLDNCGVTVSQAAKELFLYLGGSAW